MHVLGTPPAFVLSQDQTLKKLYLNNLSVAQIIFQVICSSKFYSRIFVGLNSIFTRNLNNSLLSKVFLVRLHVIQFTRYRRCSHKLSLAANFYMLSQLISFVKYFFKFLKTFLKCFKRFLVVSVALQARRRSSDNWFMLAYLPEFVKNFFLFFQISFFDLLSFAPLAEALEYISRYFLFCQHFFSLF